MHSINNLFGAFSLQFEVAGQNGLVTIHPEMAPAKTGVKPTESWFVYCVHPEDGSCTFIVEQNAAGTWISNRRPPFMKR